VPGFTYQLISRYLKEAVSQQEYSSWWEIFNVVFWTFFVQDDMTINHAACKIIENLLLISDKYAEKLATSDIALALWNTFHTVGNNEDLRASALAVKFIVRINSYLIHYCISRHCVTWAYCISMCFNQPSIRWQLKVISFNWNHRKYFNMQLVYWQY
jgi:hypothetical protein